jgi:hypothetical protein
VTNIRIMLQIKMSTPYTLKNGFYIIPETGEWWNDDLQEWLPSHRLYKQIYPWRNEGRLIRTFAMNYFVDGSSNIAFSFTNKRRDITLRSTEV